MYESPIVTYMQEMHNQIMDERENAITAKISESIGVDVDKDELIKALQYDRQQYDKGYADAKAKYESMINEMSEEVWAEIEDLNILNDFSKEIDEGMEKGLFKAVHIIDKYKGNMVQ